MKKTFLFKQAKISYTDKGKGNTIVFLHGFPESKEIWKELSLKLSRKFRIITMDLPGHGSSDCIGYVHSMELMAECVKALLKKLRLRKVILVGHSMGGYVALAFAELFSDNLKGLCLFHSTALADSEEKKKERDRAVAAVKKNHKSFVRQIVKKLFTPVNLKKLKLKVQLLQRIAEETPKQGIIAGLEGMKERRNREVVLKFAPYPVLFIAGKKDPIIPLESIKEQANLPEYSELLILKQSAHAGFYEQPLETFEAIRGFSVSAFKKS